MDRLHPAPRSEHRHHHSRRRQRCVFPRVVAGPRRSPRRPDRRRRCVRDVRRRAAGPRGGPGRRCRLLRWPDVPDSEAGSRPEQDLQRRRERFVRIRRGWPVGLECRAHRRTDGVRRRRQSLHRAGQPRPRQTDRWSDRYDSTAAGDGTFVNPAKARRARAVDNRVSACPCVRRPGLPRRREWELEPAANLARDRRPRARRRRRRRNHQRDRGLQYRALSAAVRRGWPADHAPGGVVHGPPARRRRA